MAADTKHAKQPWSTRSRIIALLVVLLGIAAIVTGVRFTVAAFSANDYMKAVAATGESENLLSSDVLASFESQPEDADVPTKTVIVNSNPISDVLGYTFKFSIFNYFENNPSLYCDKEITYDMSVSVLGSSSPNTCTINNQAIGNGVGLSGQSLAPRTASKNEYTVYVPAGDVNNVLICVSVTVIDTGGTGVRYMAANIAPTQRATVTPISVKLESAERAESNSPADFDAYNYDVTVAGNQIEVTLIWNASYVRIDPHFVAKYGGKVDGNSATFTMEPGTQRITFYRVAWSGSNPAWDDLGVGVSG